MVLLARCLGSQSTPGRLVEAPSGGGEAGILPQTNTLDECVAVALENNHRRPASAFAVAVAEAQHRQALSGYWPQLHAKGGFQRMDEAPNFVFPATTMGIPAMSIPVPAQSIAVPAQSIRVPAGTAMISVPAQMINPAAPPGAMVTLPVSTPAQTIGVPAQTFGVPAQTFGVPAQKFDVPEQDIKLMDEDSFMASLNATWLLYDGGMRKGLREQSMAGIEAAKQEARRTDLEIVDSVRRYFYGAVLARQLRQVGNDTLARMEATLNLTETMYKEGSGKVTKADFLDNKVMVESLRAMVAMLEKNEEMAKAALANTMGLSWRDTVTPADQEIPFSPFTLSLDNMVSGAYEFSPDWTRLEAGIRASEGEVRTAKSGHYPKLALTGELHRWWNDYNAGMATDINKDGWTVGVGMEIPIFEGFLVHNRVKAAQAKANRLKEQRFLLKEGIGLQVKDIFLGLTATAKSYQATLDAMKAAQENRDLNTRAYQNELVETDKVIRAQLVEALMMAQHYKTVYDHVALQSQMNLVVGTEVMKQIGATP